MKCVNCGNNEADFSCTCYVISHLEQARHSAGGNNLIEIKENGAGPARAGLCEKCVRSLSLGRWKINYPIQEIIFYFLSAVSFFSGIICMIPVGLFGGLFIRNYANLLYIPLGILIIFCGVYLPDQIMASLFLKRDPDAKKTLFGAVTAKERRYIPLGESLYPDYKRFRKINSHILEETAKKTYDTLIAADAWKQFEPQAELTGGLAADTSPNGRE